MRGKLKDLTFGAHGEQYITVTVTDDFRNLFDELKNADVDIQIKKYHKQRSLDANAYAWVLIDNDVLYLGTDAKHVTIVVRGD